MAVYYNEIDRFAAAWLRELITAGVLPAGDVDERSIVDVPAGDVRGYTQCHWFAGIGGWAYALQLAGWPADRAIWTGSCPCQPFSAAGHRGGLTDARHLWPAWFRLIRECRPAVIFGEQVEAAIRHGWLDLVCDDLEREGYAVGTCGLPAVSVDAFHIRQRLWFVAESESVRHTRGVQAPPGAEGRWSTESGISGEGGADGVLADTHRVGRSGPLHERGAHDASEGGAAPRDCHAGELGQPGGARLEGHAGHGDDRHQPRRIDPVPAGSITPASGVGWDADWVPCSDGKARPVEPGTFPLAHGVPARVGRLRGYGNAIVPQVAAEVIVAYLATRG